MKYNDKNTISIEMAEVKKGEVATIHYNGALTDHSDGNVYLHYGFDGWQKASTVPMEKIKNNTYSTNVYVSGKNEINLCFKDDKGCWDNNNGSDYKVEIDSQSTNL